jgi:cytochrome c peroxidase
MSSRAPRDARRTTHTFAIRLAASAAIALATLAAGAACTATREARTATLKYRTTPLRALWQHAPYFHDGSAATLADVVAHYDRVRKLGLSTARKHDLVEYLKSL